MMGHRSQIRNGLTLKRELLGVFHVLHEKIVAGHFSAER